MSSGTRKYVWSKEEGRFIEYFWTPPPPRVFIKGDSMEPMRNHAVRKGSKDWMVDSKSRYEASLKAAGCEVVGNQDLTPKIPSTNQKLDVKSAWERVERAQTYKND